MDERYKFCESISPQELTEVKRKKQIIYPRKLKESNLK